MRCTFLDISNARLTQPSSNQERTTPMNETPSANLETTDERKITRRQYLAAGGALLAASALPALADNNQNRETDDAEVMYGHGMVWNRDLPGIAGQLKL